MNVFRHNTDQGYPSSSNIVMVEPQWWRLTSRESAVEWDCVKLDFPAPQCLLNHMSVNCPLRSTPVYFFDVIEHPAYPFSKACVLRGCQKSKKKRQEAPVCQRSLQNEQRAILNASLSLVMLTWICLMIHWPRCVVRQGPLLWAGSDGCWRWQEGIKVSPFREMQRFFVIVAAKNPWLCSTFSCDEIRAIFMQFSAIHPTCDKRGRSAKDQPSHRLTWWPAYHC